MPANQNLEQVARDKVDLLLALLQWILQDKRAINFNAALGGVIREYQTEIGPVDTIMSPDKRTIGVIEVEREAPQFAAIVAQGSDTRTRTNRPQSQRLNRNSGDVSGALHSIPKSSGMLKN